MSGPRAKPTIDGIEPYRPGKAKALGFDKPIKLSANENPFGCSPAARAAYLAAADALHLYPDPAANALREALASKHAIEPERIVFGTGSDELFSMACQAYLSPGDEMLQPKYAFAAWPIAARAAGAEVISAPEREYTLDVDAMLAAVTPKTRVLFVANPANPTGTSVPFAEIARLHAGLPAHVLMVLDGAYAEFSRAPDEDFALARQAENIFVTHTFSKIHGLANLRIGWGYAPVAVADVLNRIRLPFNTTAPAQAAALAALADEDFVALSVAHVEAGRARLAAMLTRFGLRTLTPAANFVTALTPEGYRHSASDIERGLAARGILVRLLGNYDMPNAIRVTVGTDAQMDAFEAALEEILA